jgi:GTP cyclohydrolase I
VGENPDREGLRETPERFLGAWSFFCSGYAQSPSDILKTFEDGGYDELVFQAGIPFWSMCEHHCLPFFGYVHVAYIPNGKVVGLSKLARLVEIFARRLTVQERVTMEVADALMIHLQCKGSAVVTQARHSCMESRGVQKSGTITVCSALRGSFKEHPEVRAEFMSLVQTASAGVRSP